MAIKTYSGAVAYYALDGLGSPVALVNTDGAHIASYTYDPYGEVTISNLTNNTATAISPYRFAGGLHDRTTGDIKYGQRFYDPTTGRFTQQDSLEILADPTRANRYEYANGNPVNYVDPTGQFSVSGALFGAAAGLLAGAVCGLVTAAITGGNVVAGIVVGSVCSAIVGGLVGSATGDPS